MPKKPIINYTSTDFDTIKEDLIEHTKRFSPQKYNDFNDSSFGAIMFDAVSYVGDMLSYYLDFQANESFIESAVRYSNVRKMASNMGYNFYGRSATFGVVDFYILIPALEQDLGPIRELNPIIKKGTRLRNSSGVIFTLIEDIDFDHPSVAIVASKFDTDTGRATEYALRSSGKVKSGVELSVELDVGSAEKFKRIRIGPNAINEVISVFDAEGHEYYQVENLSQEIIYLDTTNPNAARDGVKSILKPFVASRRFIVEQDDEGTFLQFGYGSEDTFDEDGLLTPSNVMINMTGKKFITDNGFDPNKLTATDKFGISPADTTLFVRYSSNNSSNASTSINSLNQVDDIIADFPYDPDDNYSSLRGSVLSSTEVANPQPITYNSTFPTVEEIKYRAMAIKASQNRIVTKHDYEAYCYQMPPQFGSIGRVSLYNDPSGTNKRLCLYVISQRTDGSFINTNDTAKLNLRVWLNKNKMISDLIDIKDAKIINFGINYEIAVSSRYNPTGVLVSVNERLINHFSEKLYIGEPVYITEIYNMINKTEGVIDTIKVRPVLKNTAGYSPLSVVIEDILSKDGTYIKTPSNCVLELRYPTTDIKGVIV